MDLTMLAGHIFLFSVVLSCNVLCLEVNRNINVEYHQDRDAITVQIDAKLVNHSSYQVELSLNGCSEKNKSILKRDVYSSHMGEQLEFRGPFESSLYCVSAVPLNMLSKLECQTSCQPIFQEVHINSKAILEIQTLRARRQYPRQPIHTDKVNCKDAISNITPEAIPGQITARVFIESPFQSCFTSINITLWYGAHKQCDSVSGSRVDQKTVQITHDVEYKAVFRDRKPGIYCIRVYAFHPSCGGLCVRFSALKNLTNTSIESFSSESSHTDSTEVSSLVYILTGCAIFVVIVVAVSTFYFKKLSDRFPIPDREKGLTLPELLKLAKNKARKLEIVLFYSRDFEEHSDAVQALYQFLRKCFGVNSVRFDKEEEASIWVNLHSWVESVLKPKPNRVFLMVESEGSVLQEEGRRKNKCMRPEDEDILDDVFPYALQLLKRGTRGICDYKTVFVAKFQYTSEDHLLNCVVPSCRFTLPEHLFDLYCALLDLPKASLEVSLMFEDKMKKEWQGYFQEVLISKIENVSEILSKDPKKVQDSFVEQELFPYV